MNKKVAAFGEVMMRMEVPHHQLLTQSSSLDYSFSGTGVNITAALSKLGYPSTLLSTLPANPLGDAAVAYLQRLGISTNDITRSGQYMGMYFLETGFGIRPSRVTYSNRQESSFNTGKLSNYSLDIFDHIDITHFCGITLSMNENVRRQLLTMAEHIKNRDGKILFDCNYRPSLWGEDGHSIAKPYYEQMLYLADIVIMNEKDCLYILECETYETERERQVKEVIPKVSDQYNIPIIAGTHRSIHGDNTHSIRGFLYKDEKFHFASQSCFSVLDRIGTGDAFASGIIHGELQDKDANDIIEFATASCMLAHTIIGDTPMSNEEEINQSIFKDVKDIER